MAFAENGRACPGCGSTKALVHSSEWRWSTLDKIKHWLGLELPFVPYQADASKAKGLKVAKR